MVELNDKTVEELRKMASRKKIEGRSKMNKAQLVRALKKCSLTKKTVKRRKMKGGALTDEEFFYLVNRNYTDEDPNPLYFSGYNVEKYGRADPGNIHFRVVDVEEDVMRDDPESVLTIQIRHINDNPQNNSYRPINVTCSASQLTFSNDRSVLMLNYNPNP